MAARDLHGPNPPWDKGFSIIGKPNRKVDGLSKATGEALYTDDIILPGMLHAKTLRSPHPHATIKHIDVSRALALPGVYAAITGRDLPERYGVIPWTQDETALAVDKVRFIGDPVAAVAAIDEDTAIRALEEIDVEYELLHPFLDPEEALTRAEPKIHEDRKNNISKNVKLEFGDVDGSIGAADLVMEDDYSFHGTTHAPIEPHCAVARLSPDGLLTVWSATQITHYVHRALAKVLGLPEQRIRVIQPCLGGAFGGKSDPFSLEFCVAKLAMITGRPVKMLYTREEVFYCHRGRHPMKLHYRTGAMKDGRITGVDAKILIDGGSYSSFGLVTAYYAGQLLTGPYDFPTYRFDSTRVFTNKPPCGPKRGHGSVQPRFAFEVQLDEIACKLGIDPIAIRRKNFQGSNTLTVNGQRITSNGFAECLTAVENASRWKERRAKLPYGRGLGVAGSMYISGTNYCVYPNDMPQAGVQLKVDRSGAVMVFTGGNDIGQGSSSVVRYIVAEELGLPAEHVRVVAADTDLCPVDLGAYSSRVTFMVGNATIDACRKLRKLVVAAVADKWGVPETRIEMALGEVVDSRRRRPQDDDEGSLPARRSEVRHAGVDGRVQHARARREVPRRNHRCVARLLLHGARGRGARRRRDRAHSPRQDLGRARLRASAQSDARGRSDGRLGLHGRSRGRDRAPSGRRAWAPLGSVPSRLSDTHVARHTGDRIAHRRERRPRGTVRRKGSGGRASPLDDPGDRERGLRRRRDPIAPPPLLARKGARRHLRTNRQDESGGVMLRLPQFGVATPTTIAGALDILAENDKAAVLAGGTDLVPNMKHRIATPNLVLSLEGVREMRGIRVEEDVLVIGAMTRLDEIAHDERVRSWAPVLSQAAGIVASPQIRRMGTLGGNVMLDTRCRYINQTHFWRKSLGFCLKKDGTLCFVVSGGQKCVAAASNDSAPALMTLGAELVFRSAQKNGDRGERIVKTDQLFGGDGIYNKKVAPGELLTEVRVPRQASGHRGAYGKLRERGSFDFPQLGIAVRLDAKDNVVADADVVVVALQARPLRIKGAADVLRGTTIGEASFENAARTVADRAHAHCHPMPNIPGDADYRHAMVPVYVRRTLLAAAGLGDAPRT